MTIIIGLNGQFKHGKSYFAQYLIDAATQAGMVAKIIPFAEPLKQIAKDQFGWDGEKDERGRRLLQVIGTDAGREYNPRIWVDKWLETVRVAMRYSDLIIADDMRFGNEHDVIEWLQGFPVGINRHNPDLSPYREPGMEHLYAHPSEAGLRCKLEISCPSGDLDALREGARSFLCHCKQKMEDRNG